MRITSICVGNIKKISSLKKIYCGQVKNCHGIASKVKYEIESDAYKDNAVLIKIGDNEYIDIDNINNVWDFTLLCINLIKSKNIITETLIFHYATLGDLFIDQQNSNYYDLYYEVGLFKLKKLVKDGNLDKILVKKNKTKF